MRLRQSNDRPAVTDEPNHPSAVPDDETVTIPKDREHSNESTPPLILLIVLMKIGG